MKKILLGLFVLGTLGMAQQNYEVFVKSGVKISQSEVDRDSKEIENIVNKIIPFLLLQNLTKKKARPKF